MKPALILALLIGYAQAAREQPNVVVLLADDLGYGETGIQGNPRIPTPHIDSIATGGIRFTQGYVMGPNCSPSRAGLMSGRIPTRFGYEFNPIGARNEEPGIGLPASETTLAELLHGVGYTTALLGKWHLGGSAAYHPFHHGFDEFFGFTHEGHYFVPPPYQGVTTLLRRKRLPGNTVGRWGGDGKLVYSSHMGHDEPAYDANNPIIRGGQPVVEEAYLTDALTREAVSFIGRHADKPFFLCLAYNAVHSPMQGADAYMERFRGIEDLQRRIFAAMLANLDDSVGVILAKLRAEGLEKDTLVIFLSDNGGPTLELTSSNAPLRGGKSTMYEGGIRVPFLMRWPAVLPEGKVYGHPVWSADIYATAGEVAGARVPEHSDGVNLIPCLTGKNDRPPHQTMFWRQGTRTALRHGDWKITRPGNAHDAWELYDLAQDMAESNNLAAGMPEKVAELEKLWQGQNREMRGPLFD